MTSLVWLCSCTHGLSLIHCSLKIGYVALPCGVMLPVTSSNLELTAVGEDGTPPKKYSFTFKAGQRSHNLVLILKYHHSTTAKKTEQQSSVLS